MRVVWMLAGVLCLAAACSSGEDALHKGCSSDDECSLGEVCDLAQDPPACVPATSDARTDARETPDLVTPVDGGTDVGDVGDAGPDLQDGGGDLPDVPDGAVDTWDGWDATDGSLDTWDGWDATDGSLDTWDGSDATDGSLDTWDGWDATDGSLDTWDGSDAAEVGQCVTDGDCVPDDQCHYGLCVDGDCEFLEVLCPLHQDHCLVNLCQPESGLCLPVPANDGFACEDGDLCTDDDACQGGLCVGTEVVCDDGDPCTADSCAPGVGCVTAPVAEVCDNALDDDCDALVDCGDPDCFGGTDCPSEALCEDGKDNDLDKKVDCADPDCFSALCPELCGDGLDNDGDGALDCADTDCPADLPPCEPVESNCTDLLDNDGDGLVDCADGDCSGALLCGVELCADGFDNDGDGLVDCADGDCFGPACFELCADGMDNDADGAVDCADPDCFSAACDEECGSGLDEDGDGLADCEDPDCWGAECDEDCATPFDEDDDGAAGCADSDCFGPACPEACGDGLDNDGDGAADCADADCFGPVCPEVCTGGLDEDGDGGVDCADADCFGPGCPEVCTGGLDEDGDGTIDCADADCQGPGCPENCGNGFDDDGDDLVDCADSDCFGAGCPEKCTGGLDEDGDGGVDCADADCFGPACPEVCSGGLDEDGDGGVDCADSDCFGPACPEVCTGGLDEDGDGGADCADSDCFGPACPEVCAGGLDEDGDGGADCADSDCFGPGCAEVCTGGLDEDGDGAVDCADDDCAGPGCPENCDNGIDDDGDELVDCADSDCFGPACPEVCTGGLDEDGDGGADCADSDCFGPGCAEVCTGGLDEDGDGAVDCADEDCAGPGCQENCADGLDNNGDGLVDCADPQCSDDPACLGDTCAAPVPLVSGESQAVSVAGRTDGVASTCFPPGTEDVIFSFELTEESDVHLDTGGSEVDTGLVLLAGACPGGEVLGCNDNATLDHDHARLELPALPAGTYYVALENLEAGEGQATLYLLTLPVLPPPVNVHDDPLVRMPGTQPGDGITLEGPNKCLNCHAGYDQAVEPGFGWQGSMMAQAARDPIFWSCFTVALQDSKWAVGSPNAGDICLRCHFPGGWVQGRSDPPTGAAMTGADYDGIHCDSCHRQIDPFHAATAAGTREGDDWYNYWDETNLSDTPSTTMAQETLVADQAAAAGMTRFNGEPLYAAGHPGGPSYVEAAGGQYYFDGQNTKRASFADAAAKHKMLYSRFHKSRYACNSCHDVSNPALANLAHAGAVPGDGVTELPTELNSASSYFHVERTFSEFMLSAYGQQGGAAGTGPFAPESFNTSQPGNFIASCQDCHMRDKVGAGCDKAGVPIRPDDSVEHPQSGQPHHDFTGGNVFVPALLASTVPGSPNYDPTNAALLGQGSQALTMDLAQGTGLNPAALLDASVRAQFQLQSAATIQNAGYDAQTGELTFQVHNHTGHKLLSGFQEGRRMFLNVVVSNGDSVLLEINPYDEAVGTIKGLPPEYSANSPALAANEVMLDEMIYEVHPTSSLTGEEQTFHFVLGTGRHKDNRIPPQGFDVVNSATREADPVWHGESTLDYFSEAEYAGGYDQWTLTVPAGATQVAIKLYYQTTTREYVEFLRNEINGDADSLPPGGPSALTYVAQFDPDFDPLRAWGDTIWELWLHNQEQPGMAPILMTSTLVVP